MSMDNPDQPPESEFEVDDPEELSQKKRVREILNRRNEALEARNRAKDEQLLGGSSHDEAVAHYQSRIESLVIDLHTKFKNIEQENDDDGVDGTRYFNSVDIDTVIVPPPGELVPDNKNDMAPGESTPSPKEVQIEGLKWFIENEPVVQKQFTVRSWNPPGTRTAVGQRLIPFKTLDKALMRCMEFIDEIGIDANLSESEQRTKIDRELLEEVDEWRQKNVE